MSRNFRYDILFEPVKIGPVTAPNRFYCTPHALGTGNQMPHTRAAMREVRAEGGWGVVNTGYCSIHPSSVVTHVFGIIREMFRSQAREVTTSRIPGVNDCWCCFDQLVQQNPALNTVIAKI